MTDSEKLQAVLNYAYDELGNGWATALVADIIALGETGELPPDKDEDE